MRNELNFTRKTFLRKNVIRKAPFDLDPAQDRKRDPKVPNERAKQKTGKQKKRIGMDRIGGRTRQKKKQKKNGTGKKSDLHSYTLRNWV